MTQNTLSEEIEVEINKFADSMPGRICFMLVTGNDFENILTQFRLHMRSIAEKTVEAVRVEEKDFNEQGGWESHHARGYNAAVTEQSKLASHWLGKENDLAKDCPCSGPYTCKTHAGQYDFCNNYDCLCHPNTNDWEGRFSSFVMERGISDSNYVQLNYEKLKDFIRKELALAEARGEARGAEKVINAIPDNMLNGYEAPGVQMTTVKEQFKKIFLTP